MLKKIFLIYGITITLMFVYATHTGWSVVDSFSSGKWDPHGKNSTTYHAYHK